MTLNGSPFYIGATMEIKNLLREKSLAESTAEYIQVILTLNQQLQELTEENQRLKELSSAPKE